MNAYDYSELDIRDGLDTRGPKPYVAIITVKPAPEIPSWSRKMTAIVGGPPLVLIVLAIVLMVADLWVR